MPIVNTAQQPVIDPAFASGIASYTHKYNTLNKMLEDAREAQRRMLAQEYSALLQMFMQTLSKDVDEKDKILVRDLLSRYRMNPVTGTVITQQPDNQLINLLQQLTKPSQP